MQKVKLNLRGLSIPEKLARGRQIVAAMAGNANFPTPQPRNRVDGARTYAIELSPDPPTAESWKHETVSTRSSATVQGLTSGTKYWFRVASINAQGQSGWSNPAVRIAP